MNTKLIVGLLLAALVAALCLHFALQNLEMQRCLVQKDTQWTDNSCIFKLESGVTK